MPIHDNCTRGAGVLSAVVLTASLSLPLNGWASSRDGVVVPEIKSQAHPVSISKQLKLANDYLFGRGVAQDLKLSAFWLQKASNSGDPEAQMELGYFYESGIGVAKSPQLAAHWYQLAAHSGMPEAKMNLGTLYFWGSGVAEDREMAAKLFREAAEKGIGMAAYQLGMMYSLGTGVVQNKATAEEWFTKGARRHNPQAQYRLGLIFFDEPDHTVDLRKAESLLHSSAASGFVPAMYTLGLLLSLHPDLAKSPGEATQFLDDAASAGDWESSQALGILARDGKGMPKDDKAAYFNFKVAALQGGNEAEKSVEADLQRLTATLAPALISVLDAEAQGWYEKHHLALEFVYKSNDGRGRYPVSALVTPGEGQHELQLLQALPGERSPNRELETAHSMVQ